MHKSDQTETGRLCARMTDRLRLAHAALNQVTEALAEPDSDMEEGLLAVERTLRELREELADQTAATLNGDAPTREEVRAVVTEMYIGGDLGRLAVLVQEIAEIAWARCAKRPLPEAVRSLVQEMSQAALSVMTEAEEAAKSEALEAAKLDLDHISREQHQLCRLLLSGLGPSDIADVAEAAVLGRCYEECTYRAVSAARHIGMLKETAPG